MKFETQFDDSLLNHVGGIEIPQTENQDELHSQFTFHACCAYSGDGNTCGALCG